MTWLGLFLICIVSRCSNSFNADLYHVWNAYRDVYPKPFPNAKYAERSAMLQANTEMVVNHNIEADLGKHTYWLGLNRFSDMTGEESDIFQRGIAPDDEPLPNRNALQPMYNRTSAVITPEELDYRRVCRVNPVRDQKWCRCGYAFAALGALEGQWKKFKNHLPELSVQNVVDCSKENGCKGGLPETVYIYVISNNGICTKQTYPYQAKTGTCRFSESDVGATARSFFVVPPKNESLLKEAVYVVGPIATVLNASLNTFKHYKCGVYDPVSCDVNNFTGALLIAGYGVDKQIEKIGKPYWLLRNSWGVDWGENGYMRMIRDKNNGVCGIAMEPIYPVI